jgi:transcriptional regulator with PAS, ATPase and Fis domain
MWEVIKRHALEDSHSENLFISGEMGVGKDLVAQAVARLKDPDFRLKEPCYPLRENEFLPFNCNVTETLFLSEMFGTKPGAFSDAKDNPGLIERAGNGVLFLDQFCSISEASQR